MKRFISGLLAVLIFSSQVFAVEGIALDKHPLIEGMQESLDLQVAPFSDFTNAKCVAKINEIKISKFTDPESNKSETVENILATKDTTGNVSEKIAKKNGPTKFTPMATLAGAGMGYLLSRVNFKREKKIKAAVEILAEPKAIAAGPGAKVSQQSKRATELAKEIKTFDANNPQIMSKIKQLFTENSTWNQVAAFLHLDKDRDLISRRIQLSIELSEETRNIAELNIAGENELQVLLKTFAKQVNNAKSTPKVTKVPLIDSKGFKWTFGGAVAGFILGLAYEINTQSKITDSDKQYTLEQILARVDAGGVEPRIVCNKAFDGSRDGNELKRELNLALATMDQYFTEDKANGRPSELPKSFKRDGNQ